MLDERVRIARELHDVVAHHVSVMGVQAGAARRVMRQQPEKAGGGADVDRGRRAGRPSSSCTACWGSCAATARTDGLAPQPDLGRLPELVGGGRRRRAAGRAADRGRAAAAAGTLELSAYRVIQEALTNTRKHAGARTATVRVAYGPSTLEIEVVDDGRGGAAPAGGGHGLIGMRERVRLARRPPARRAATRRRLRGARHVPAERAARMTIRVVLVDDQAMVRAGFRLILEAEDDIAIVGEASDGEEAVEVTRRLRPDVVLMDVQMPRMDGLEATRRLGREPGVDSRVVILTTFEQDDYVFEALRAGASGFLLKNARPEDLVHAVRVVASGDALLAPAITRRVIQEYARRPARPRDDAALELLTERELEVLRLLATGLSNAELAAQLFLGEGTVKTHVSHVLAKLGLRDRVQAVVFAYESGLVEPRER